MKNRTTLVTGLLLSATLGSGAAQDRFVLRGATVHTLAGDDIEAGTVLLQDGRITAVGKNLRVPAGAEVIDLTGMHLYPGMIDAMGQLGLTEIGQVAVTSDSRELGDYNPHLMAATAVHPASEHIPVARSNGVTHAVTAPQGGPGSFPGQAALIHLDGWTVEEMIIEASAGMILTYPSLGGGGRFFRFVGRRPFREMQEEYEERVTQIELWLDEARRYAQAVQAGTQPRRDLRLEAMSRMLGGDIPLIVIANGERNIRNALDFAERNELEIILAGGRQAWKLADELASKNIPVILSGTQAMPSGADEAYDEAYAQPGMLHAAGVKFAFATFNSSNSRVLPYEAAMAVGFGLPWEAALRAVTVNAAEILGVGDLLGTIEVGKIGNLIVTDGDPLNIQTQVTHLFINGKPASLDNQHLRHYQRWRARP